MQDAKVHRCQCPCCADGRDDPEHERHAQLNLLLSRCDEQQRRWWVAWEANYLGHGGAAFMSLVTGLHPETIRRGQAELAAGLTTRPSDRVRLPGAGRPPVEKKHLGSSGA